MTGPLGGSADEGRLGSFLLWGGVAVLALGAGFFAAAHWALGADYSTMGQFGDTFGALNAAFSGLALAGVIYAVVLQSQELGLQREELVQTRAEIAGQREEMQLQNETLRAQLYESSFLELLSQFREVAGGMGWPWGREGPLRGAAAFMHAGSTVSKNVVGRVKQLGVAEAASQTFAGISNKPEVAALTRYLSFCTELLAWIAEAPDLSRERYLRLWRSQLTPGEQAVLVTWAVSKEGSELARHAAVLRAFRDFTIETDLRSAVGAELSTAFLPNR